MKLSRFLFILFSCVWLLVTGCNRRRSYPQCRDGIQNQNETAVDCGGVCSPCASCNDGIQNQDEIGVDCGGPCNVCPVSYPVSGLYGTNILGPYSAGIYSGNSCSASAEVSANASLRVVIKNMSDDNSSWTYKPVSVRGWAIDAYNPASKSQQLIAIGKKSCHVELIFTGKGSADIEFYENGAVTPTFKRHVYWE